MGQALTHGVYLPDEGERNCYSGLASNWAILDNAVGTVAEHTSALADKAPLVHTHTKSDITDFPVLATVATSGSYNDLSNIPATFAPSSHVHGNLTNDGKIGTVANVPLITGTGGAVQAGSFGNSANTFCEGNDSRLSDARTPVAHTHTKSDVTNLLNSDFIPSANNSYDLGSSAYQWNNLYAKRVNTQSVNGINPGALSLPDTTREEPIDRTNWVYTYNAANIYYPPEDGWLAVACSGSDYIQLDGDMGWGITLSKGYDGFCTGIIPVKKNKRVQIRIRETSSGSVVVRKASFYPGTGDPTFTVTSSS